MPKYSVNIQKNSGDVPSKTEYATKEEMISVLSDFYGEPISLIDYNFISGTIIPDIDHLKNALPAKYRSVADSLAQKTTGLLEDFENYKVGEESSKFEASDSKKEYPDSVFKIIVESTTGVGTKLPPLKESDAKVFQQEFASFSGELDSILSDLGGMNLDDYTAGQELSTDDIAKLEILNLKYSLDKVQKGISHTMQQPDSIFASFAGTGVLGTPPQVGSDVEKSGYTPEMGRIMISVLPTVMLQYQANQMSDIQLSYKEKLSNNGFDPEAERRAKLDYLRQAAKMKPLTSQCIMVGEEPELFGLGAKEGSKVFTNGTADINGDRSAIVVMDGNLEMYDTGIRRGWLLSDLDTLGKLEYLSRRTNAWEKNQNLSDKEKEDLKGFRDFVSEVKQTDIKNPEDRERMLRSALDHINALPEKIKEGSKGTVGSARERVEESLNRQLSEAEKREIGNLGSIKEELDKIEVKSFSKEQFEELKERAERDMEYASSTLQAKGIIFDNNGDLQSSISGSEAINAFKGILNKNDSFFHWDSKQFKTIKTGLQKVLDGTASAKERSELTQNVKTWLTDPKYDRIHKHSRNNFDNTRFNDMFALANELDPKWAHENFDRMNISGLHGNRAADTKFENVDDFLQYEQKLIVNKNCLKNGAAQKSQPWFQEGYSPAQDAMIRDVEKTWKSPEFTDKMRFDAELKNIQKIGMGFTREVREVLIYTSKLACIDGFTNDDGTINKVAFQEERDKAVKSVEDYIKNPENRGKKEFEKAVAIYGVLEPVKATTLIKEMKAANKENEKIQNLDLAAIEKKGKLDIGGRKEFKQKRAEARAQEKQNEKKHTM